MTERLTRDELDRCTHRYCNKCDEYRKELQRYKDLEEQGRIYTVEDDLFPLLQTYKPNQERCKTTLGMTMEEASARFAKYQSLEEQGRLVVLPEVPVYFKRDLIMFFTEHAMCPENYGFKNYVEEPCRGLHCKMCWEKALKGE